MRQLAFAFASATLLAQPALADDGVTFFGAQRFWFATQSTTILDAAIVVPPTGGATAIETRLAPINSSAVVSITSLGLRKGDWLFTASLSPSAGFDGKGQVNGQITRSETDLTVGYSLQPGTTLSLIYKDGAFKPDQTTRSEQLLGANGSKAKGRALLLGISSSASLGESLSLYGNFAYGPGRWTSTNNSRSDTRYTVADFGLSYRVGGAANLALQLGYRSQTVSFSKLPLGRYSTTGQVLSTQQTSTQSTTQGLVVGLGASF